MNKLFLRAFFSLLVIILVYWKVDFRNFHLTLTQANPSYLFLTFVMINLNYLISGFRWRSLIFYSKKFSGFKVWYLTKLYYIGAFFNNFMPTSIGGDVYKAYVLGKKTNEMAKSAAATFINRLAGLIVLALFSSISLIILWGILGFLIFIGFWVLIILGFVFLGFLSRFSKRLESFEEALYLYRSQKRALFSALFFSILVQLAANLAGYFSAKSLGINISLEYAFFIFPIIGFLSFLPISFNGIGIQDFLYKFFLVKLGYLDTLALGASLLYHIVRMGVSLVGGALLVTDPETLNDISKRKK